MIPIQTATRPHGFALVIVVLRFRNDIKQVDANEPHGKTVLLDSKAASPDLPQRSLAMVH